MRPRWRSAAAASEEPAAEVADALLVRRAQGTPAAFAPLYARYRDRVVADCFYRLGDRDEAEDAAGAVFVNALRHLAAFADRDGSFRSRLFRIARNEVVDRRRRARHPVGPLAAARGRRDASIQPPTAWEVGTDFIAMLRPVDWAGKIGDGPVG